MPGSVKLDISPLLAETGAKPVDLIHAGISQVTAYRIYHGRAEAITFVTLQKLCDLIVTGKRLALRILA